MKGIKVKLSKKQKEFLDQGDVWSNSEMKIHHLNVCIVQKKGDNNMCLVEMSELPDEFKRKIKNTFEYRMENKAIGLPEIFSTEL